MDKNFLFDLLIDPKTGEQLEFVKDSSKLRSSVSGNEYRVVDTVPDLIIGDNHSIVKPDIHQKFDSEFNYTEHYQRDADIFNYSVNEEPGVSKRELSFLHKSIIKEIQDDYRIILDVGCGGSWVSKELIPMGKKVISMDISLRNPLNAVREVRHNNHAGLVADVFNLPFKENSLDCIIAAEILEHVADPKTMILNLSKLLRNNGKLIITTPYNEKIEYNLCVHCNRPTPRNAHLHSFNEINIKQYLPEEGVIVRIKKLHNKFLLKIRLHVLFKFLPYKLWLLIDSLCNKFIKSPGRIQITIIKC